MIHAWHSLCQDAAASQEPSRRESFSVFVPVTTLMKLQCQGKVELGKMKQNGLCFLPETSYKPDISPITAKQKRVSTAIASLFFPLCCSRQSSGTESCLLNKYSQAKEPEWGRGGTFSPVSEISYVIFLSHQVTHSTVSCLTTVRPACLFKLVGVLAIFLATRILDPVNST